MAARKNYKFICFTSGSPLSWLPLYMWHLLHSYHNWDLQMCAASGSFLPWGPLAGTHRTGTVHSSFWLWSSWCINTVAYVISVIPKSNYCFLCSLLVWLLFQQSYKGKEKSEACWRDAMTVSVVCFFLKTKPTVWDNNKPLFTLLMTYVTDVVKFLHIDFFLPDSQQTSVF